MSTFIPAARACAAAVLIACSIAGCGGGGNALAPGVARALDATQPSGDAAPPSGDTTPPPPPGDTTPQPPGGTTPPPPADTRPPVLSFASSPVLDVTGSVIVSSDEVLGTSGYVIRVIRADDSEATGLVRLAQDRRSFSWTPAQPLPYNGRLRVAAAAQDPSGNRSTIEQVATTPPPPYAFSWWPPRRPMIVEGVKARDPSALAADCVDWTAPCWQQPVESGSVQTLASSALAAGRSIAFEYYRSGAGLDVVMPVFLDDGSPLAGRIAQGAAAIDWAKGTPNGVMAHDPASNTCTEYLYNGPASSWGPRPVACPADITPPVLTRGTTSPVAAEGPITYTSDEPLLAAQVTVFTGDIIEIPGSVTLAPDRRSFSWTPATAMTYFLTQIDFYSEAADLAGNRTPAWHSFRTGDRPGTPAWWPPGHVAPMDEKVFTPDPLPPGCGIRGTCWENAVRAGTVKFLRWGVAVGAQEPTWAAFFVQTDGSAATSWCLQPVYVEDGLPPFTWYGALPLAQMAYCQAGPVEWVMGINGGFMVQAGGSCTKNVGGTPAACP